MTEKVNETSNTPPITKDHTPVLASLFKPVKVGGIPLSAGGALCGVLLTRNIGGVIVGAVGGGYAYDALHVPTGTPGSTDGGGTDPGTDPDPDPDPNPDPDPEPDPNPDPDPDPDPEPDPGPNPEPLPSVFDVVKSQKGSWSLGQKPASIKVEVIDRFVSVTLVHGTRSQVVPLLDVKRLVPNDVLITGISPAVLDTECQTSFGKNLYSLLTDGATGVDDYMSGFYLIDVLNRDNVIKGVPRTAVFATEYQETGIWGLNCSPVVDWKDTLIKDNSNWAPGEAMQIWSREFSFMLNFGSSVDKTGIPNSIGSLGDLMKEIALGTKCVAVPNADFAVFEADAWGTGHRRLCHPGQDLNKVATLLRDMVLPDFRSGQNVTFSDLCLYYIDNPSIRKQWNEISIANLPVKLAQTYVTCVEPFLRPGDQIQH